jgi:outer membrane protein, multidrug efflux system
MNIKLLAGLLCLLVLSACKTLKPAAPLSPAPPPVSYGSGGDSTQASPIGWRQVFTDPALSALIDTALARNPDRQMALATIRQAEAELLRARAPLVPQVQAMLSGSAERFGDYTMNGIGNFDLNRSSNVPPERRVPNPVTDIFTGFRASWEIDLWGRLKAQRHSAAARVLASAEGEQWLRTNLVAGVATMYFELLALDAEILVAEQNIALQERALEVVEAQKIAGRATELAVQQFRAQIFNTRTFVFGLRQRVQITENGLRLLLGRYDGTIPRGRALTAQTLPERIQSGLPAQLLNNRPDIRQAGQLLAAASADVYAARAALLPNFTITPYAGVQAFRASVLLIPESAALGLLGGLSAPVFNRKALLANRNASLAVEQQALLYYQRSLIMAYAEVQNELRQFDNLQNAFPLKQAEVGALQKAVEASNDLYTSGYANYLEVITAQRSALAAALELQELRKNQFINLINLYRALGGG